MILLRNIIGNNYLQLINNSINIKINGIKHSSDAINLGDMYICLRGSVVDGHEYWSNAVAKGAIAIVSDKPLKVPNRVVNIVVNSTRIAYAQYAAAFYGNPQDKLKLIGVVGTNGKTTTSKIIYDILRYNGVKAGLIGTSGNYIGDEYYSADMTTPDPMELYSLLREMVDKELEVVAMEISAHAIALDKIYGLNYEACIFTNLSQDHLDYFHDMNTYGNVKKSIFLSEQIKCAVINVDDELGHRILLERKGISYGYSLSVNNDSVNSITASNIEFSQGKTSFILNCSNCNKLVFTRLIGDFNVYNILGAIAALRFSGILEDYTQIISAVKEIDQIEGRFNTKYSNGRLYVVDYAHSPDGLENVLRVSKRLVGNNGRLIVVFGCGGNRDITKRPIMGQIAANWADIVVLTSDNPRNENRNDIINDIIKGIDNKGKSIYIYPDRYYAVNQAVFLAREGDVVIIAGKGAEDYIEESGLKTPYNDKLALEQILGEKWSTNY